MAKNVNLVKTIVMPAVCLFSVCLVTTALLAFTNQKTAPVIAENIRLNAERIYKEMLPEVEAFDSTVIELNNQSYDVQIGKKNNEVVGYVFNTETPGYGGPVVVLTAIRVDGKIAGAQILSMQETAGLGMNASKPEFIGQFVDKNSQLKVVKETPKADDEIQAISAATITSNSVTHSINTAMDIFAVAQGKGAK